VGSKSLLKVARSAELLRAVWNSKETNRDSMDVTLSDLVASAPGPKQQEVLVELVRPGLVVIQPTPFCNIDCSYCYLNNRSDTSRMSSSTLRAVARFLLGVPIGEKPLSIVWHAGEPMVVPVTFYEEAFRSFAPGDGSSPFRHHFQTNGTLIDDSWCSLFKKWSVCVGVSIDGPKQLHDKYRVDRFGRGTFDRVMKGIDALRAHGLRFSVLTVITRETLDMADELWEFFKDLGASHVGFNVEENEGAHRHSSLASGEFSAKLRRFFARMAELHQKNPNIRVRELEDMRRHLTAPCGSVVTRSNNRPGAILNIDSHGNFTTFSPELLGLDDSRYGRFTWGNVHHNDWSSLARHRGFLKAHAEISAGIELCRRSCQYFAVCGGGNPSNKLAECGTFVSTETLYCQLHVQAVADAVMEQMEREMAAPTASLQVASGT